MNEMLVTFDGAGVVELAEPEQNQVAASLQQQLRNEARNMRDLAARFDGSTR
jgi:hypothetical protein